LLTDSINASLSHTIYPFFGSSPTNTVTIKPAPTKNVVLTAFSFSGVFNIQGVSNFIIDGSNLPGGNTHNLYLNNLDGTGAPVITFNALDGYFSRNVTIKNSNLIGGGSSYSSYGVTCIGLSTVDSFNIINNRFWNLVVGINLYGDATNPIEGCTIANNTFGSVIDTLRLSRKAIQSMFTKGLIIRNNIITNLLWGDSEPIGIDLGYGNTQTQIIGNTITGIKYNGVYDYGAIGIKVQTQTTNSEILIANNIISDISGKGSSEPEFKGINAINTSNTHGIKILNNSINLFGDITGQNINLKSAAVYIGFGTEALTLANNIFRNTLVDLNYANTKAYALYSQADSWMQTQIDYNCYFTSGSQGVMAFVDGVEYFNVVDLNLDTGTDSFSLNADPLFNDPYTLIPSLSSPVLGAGTPLTEVTTDFLGLSRSLSNPSIGAYENGAGSSNKNLVITLLLEGLYDSSGMMRKASNGTVALYPGFIADQVTVELHDPANYANTIYSQLANLTTIGTITLNIPSSHNQQYYITVKHRSHLDVTTATPISFEFDLVDCPMDMPSLVYSNNLKQSADGYWLVYGGNVNQDAFVDHLDLEGTAAGVSVFLTGNVPEDVDCNGVVDAHDLILIDNNYAVSAQSYHP
jgi:hypothetical protein